MPKVTMKFNVLGPTVTQSVKSGDVVTYELTEGVLLKKATLNGSPVTVNTASPITHSGAVCRYWLERVAEGPGESWFSV